jgi:RNase P subunit RPR2
MARNRRKNNRQGRSATAKVAQQHLIGILSSPREHSEEVVDSAAVHLMKISRRHRLSIPPESRHLVCRKCWIAQSIGGRVRVRIKSGQRTTTCLKCGSIRRYGGGPKYHRSSRGDL